MIVLPCNIGTRNWRQPDQWTMRSIILSKLNIFMNTPTDLRSWNQDKMFYINQYTKFQYLFTVFSLKVKSLIFQVELCKKYIPSIYLGLVYEWVINSGIMSKKGLPWQFHSGQILSGFSFPYRLCECYYFFYWWSKNVWTVHLNQNSRRTKIWV